MDNGAALLATLRQIFGVDVPPTDIGFGQMVARALLVYLAGLVILRLGQHRFLGKNTAFDVVLGFVLGSMLSRAVNGSAAIFATIVGCAALVGLHWLFAAGAFRSHRFGSLVKGEPLQLVRGGEIDWDAMRKSRIGLRDLEEAMRSAGLGADLSRLAEAHLERSGTISVVPRAEATRVVDVEVGAGVQTVRLVVG